MVVLSVFPHPGFKFLACSYSDRECQEGKTGLTCLQFCLEGRDQAAFVSIEIFSNIYWWFWNIFIFWFLSTFAVAMLWFAFCSVVCCLRVLWFWCLGGSHRSNPLLLLCFLFSLSQGVIFKARWRFNVILFLQLSSQVCCFFCISPFSYSLYFCWCQVFLDVIIFWLDDAGWTRGVLILGGVQCVFVFCINEDEQTFSLLQVYEWISCCAYNKEWGDRNMHLWLTCYFARLAELFI